VPVPLRPAVSGLPAYVAGRPAPTRSDLVTYKLSSNENPFPPLTGVLEAVAQASASMNRYPDIANTRMAEALGARLGVDADRLAFGTGSVGVLYHLLQAVCGPGDEVVHAWRSFEAYPIAVLLCSPNNPTGPALRHDEVVAFVDAVPDDVLVVVDEAYVEFVTSPTAVRGLEVAAGRDNVVVLRTFSKAYGLAGFRVGYCVAAPPLAQAVRAVALPFGVSLPAQAAVIASLEHEPELLARVAELVARRDALAAGLRDVGLDVPDAQGNFVWLPAGPGTADVAATFGGAGLVVRPYVSGDPGDGVRITVGEPEANARVLEVAARLAGTVSGPA
jgi:histidinol-phosphate aminotransferase